MAVMWPRQLPISVRDDERRHAEVRTYDRLRHELGDEFTVFYSSPWLGTDAHGTEKDGECDFLVAHPRLGYVAIEVKGGGISYDPEHNQWKSRDRHGFRHKIKDPVKQARDAKHELLKKLKGSGRWRERFIHIAHGVVFPDAKAPPRDLGADRPAHLFCCSAEFSNGLRAWIGQRLCEARPSPACQPLGVDGVAAFERILASPFQLHFTVSAAMADAAEQLGVLEPTQYHILDHISDVRRAEIRGGAGTGKTVIAAEEALRLANSGLRTLLTCHSAPLAVELARRLSNVANLKVASFHALCGQMSAKAGTSLTGSGSEFFNEIMPAALLDAAAALPSERWDAVVVDEGQDFRQNWWIALTALLSQECCVRVMSDTNQRIYDVGRVPGVDLELIPIRLTRNLRNTRAIYGAAAVHYEGPDITPVGPDGPSVNWIAVTTQRDLIGAAIAELRRLVYVEELAPSDIAVLLPSTAWLDDFRAAAANLALGFASAEGLELDEVVLDTVRRFKGLERPAVILVAAPCDMLDTELAYVGFTRPKTYLAVVSTTAQQPWLRGGETSDQQGLGQAAKS